MSLVFRAHDEVLDRTVALKLLAGTLATNPRFIDRFYAEARTAAQIVDPNVVAIYDIIATGLEHAIVMEFLDGPSLAELLAQRTTLTEREVILYARQTASALAAAHEQGHLHRDVKPANLLLTADRATLKVADFGLARALESESNDQTMLGGLVGSVHYFSPEQARNFELTAASDLYSVGIIVVQMCTGKVPFAGASPLAVAQAHVSEPPPTQAELRRSMSAPLASIVARLLEKEPAARYQNAIELERDLAALDRSAGEMVVDPALDAPTLFAPAPPATPRRARPEPKRAARKRPSRLQLGATSVAVALASAAERTAAAIRADRGLAAICALLVAIFLIVAFVPRRQIGALVPDVRGASTTDARSRLRAMGFDVALRMRADRRIAAGGILSQSLAAGAYAPRGTRVELLASSGLPRVTIPSVLGRDYREAVALLEHTRLRVSYIAEVTAAPANTIVFQRPAPGSNVIEGTVEYITISTGPDPTVRVRISN